MNVNPSIVYREYPDETGAPHWRCLLLLVYDPADGAAHLVGTGRGPTRATALAAALAFAEHALASIKALAAGEIPHEDIVTDAEEP